MDHESELKSQFLQSVRRVAGGRERADFASHYENSKGRQIVEVDSPTRTGFQRDRDRVIHSDAFRRLKHKTQVFVHHQDDHFRTRLTHTIEVGQIARALARALKLDEDLAEAIALVHDFGHPPFGHAGERVLDQKMSEFGGFDHNVQSLRVVTKLEKRYAAFDGLNLTWETLEGLVKHNGPLVGDNDAGRDGIPEFVRNVDSKIQLRLESWASLEAQCAAIADDIAYNNHDLDDGLRAGLFDKDRLREVSLCDRIVAEIDRNYPDLDRDRLHHEIVRRQTTLMVEDVIYEALTRLTSGTISDIESVRNAGREMVTFSTAMANEERELKAFLFANMYRSPIVMRSVEAAETILSDLFDRYWQEPGSLESKMHITEESKRARAIADYLAGMTDRFAVSEHRRLFDHTPELR